jgi:hypothetical protein
MTGAAKRKAERDCSDERSILRRVSPELALSRRGQSYWRCRFLGVKRTYSRHRRNDTNDLKRTSFPQFRLNTCLITRPTVKSLLGINNPWPMLRLA